MLCFETYPTTSLCIWMTWLYSARSGASIYSTSWTLTRLARAGLTVKMAKCQFAMTECTYLGHVGGRVQVKPLTAKVAAVQEFLTPKRKRDVCSFLGLADYYRSFVPQYATNATPLTQLTMKDQPNRVQWTDTHQQAFTTLKATLASDPVLQGPDIEREIVLQTDASDVGIGAILSQTSEAHGDCPVAYFSRKLNSREKNYDAVEKECLAIVDSIQHFQVYLTWVPFTVVLHFLDKTKDVGGRLTRWSLRLQLFAITIQHCPGSENGNADGLCIRHGRMSPTW